MTLAIHPSTRALRWSLSTNNNNNRDNARNATPRDPFSYGQIANIISYRIITANCSGLPLPTNLHTYYGHAGVPARFASLISFRRHAVPLCRAPGRRTPPSSPWKRARRRDQVRRRSRKHTVNSNLAELYT